MKTIYFVRHAKSAWQELDLSDHKRGLLPKGEKKTKKIAVWMKNNNAVPDLIITSSATRAKATAKIIAKNLNIPKEKIIVKDELYHGGMEEILAALYGLPNKLNSVMIVGHNPTMTDIVNYYLSDDDQLINFPTSAVASINFFTDKWENLSLAKHKVKFVMFPSKLE